MKNSKKSFFILLLLLMTFTSCKKYDCETTDTTTLVGEEIKDYELQCGAIPETLPDPDLDTASNTEAIGYYSSGSLKMGEDINQRSGNVHKIFTGRKRSYATREMLDLVTDIADEMDSRFSNIEKLQVGDLSGNGGGSAAPNHNSHQNGLDVDIVYYSKSRKLQASNAGYWEQYFVSGGNLVDFDLHRNWEMFKFIVARGNVGRIFVDPVIKSAMCNYAKEKGEFDSNIETLRRLRSLSTHHETHFHLRLKCPDNDNSCTNQEEPSSGSGC